MTAEIAILNREAVALAADSAITARSTDGQKIFTSGNKIFALSRIEPVAIMIYGNSALLDVPWETIIKLYRERLGSRAFSSLDEYTRDFFSFLDGEQGRLFPEDSQERYVQVVIAVYLIKIQQEVDRLVQEKVAQSGAVAPADIAAILDEVVVRRHKAVLQYPEADGLPRGYSDRIKTRYVHLIDEGIEQLLQEHKPRGRTKRLLHELSNNLLSRHVPGHAPLLSGVVFAGFGEADVFPALREFHVEGYAADFLKKHLHSGSAIDVKGNVANVRAFAQSEMVVRFMEGVDPEYEKYIEEQIEHILRGYPAVLLQAIDCLTDAQRQELATKFDSAAGQLMSTVHDQLRAERTRVFADPITELVNALPKEELGAMAESLVNLTSLKRRLSWDSETVSGPIDVAVISKGDGLIWIKRKHYFNPDLNPHFFAARYGSTRI